MISVYSNKEDCYGCSACASVCPTQAISMQADEEGFLYPKIDTSLCIDCGLCRQVCPFHGSLSTDLNSSFTTPEVSALIHRKEEVLMKSASGGAFTAITDYALEYSYVLYGATFSEGFAVQHGKARNKKDRDKLSGSKYVQSNLGSVFNEMRDSLNSGGRVLFSGTPCQVAGLSNLIEVSCTPRDNLMLIDIVCHGSPSPKLWEQYLKLIQRKDNLAFYSFRNKEKGWHGYNIKAVFGTGKVKTNTPEIRVFAKLFSSDLALRPSCYSCRFASFKRFSDITIGDYWGVEKVLPDLDSSKGVSLVLVNTDKGRAVFDAIKKDVFFCRSNTKDCLQPNLQMPTKLPAKRSKFWDDYDRAGFKYIAKKYGGLSFKARLRSALAKAYRRVRHFIRNSNLA